MLEIDRDMESIEKGHMRPFTVVEYVFNLLTSVGDD